MRREAVSAIVVANAYKWYCDGVTIQTARAAVAAADAPLGEALFRAVIYRLRDIDPMCATWLLGSRVHVLGFEQNFTARQWERVDYGIRGLYANEEIRKRFADLTFLSRQMWDEYRIAVHPLALAEATAYRKVVREGNTTRRKKG